MRLLVWLFLFPFKLYALFVPPICIFVFEYHHASHTAPPAAIVFLFHGLFPCAVILLTAAFVLWLWDVEGFAKPCLFFGLFAAVTGLLMLWAW